MTVAVVTHDRDGERWQMKPVVELLLREIRAVALHARPIHERRHDIKWLLDTAGF